MMGGRGGGTPSGRQDNAAAPSGGQQGQLFSDDVSLPLDVRVAVALEEIRRAQGDDMSDFQRVDQLHDKLSDMPSGVLNETLARMGSTDRTIILNPQSNQKILTLRQRNTAVRLGGQDKHLIKLMPRGRDALLKPPS